MQRSWAVGHHGRMNAHSEDLRRKKIVEAVERAMPNIEAVRTFAAWASLRSSATWRATVRGDPSLRRKTPRLETETGREGARKLLEANLEEHPEATLPQRREFLQRVHVEFRSATLRFPGCSGAWGLDPKKRSVVPARDEWLRAAWRTLWWPRVSTRIGFCVRGRDGSQHHLAGALVCLLKTRRAGACERATQLGSENVTLLASMSAEGMGPCAWRSKARPRRRFSRPT